MDIQYPHVWCNLRDEDFWFFITIGGAQSVHSVGRIEVGYYDGYDKLIRTINYTLAGIMVEKKVKLC